MASRFFFTICVIALFVAIASAQSTEEPDFEEYEDEISRGALKYALGILKQEFSKIKTECYADAVKLCGFNILHPKRLYKCAAAYFKENKEHCRANKDGQ